MYENCSMSQCSYVGPKLVQFSSTIPSPLTQMAKLPTMPYNEGSVILHRMF